jgi:hypothetical protein
VGIVDRRRSYRDTRSWCVSSIPASAESFDEHNGRYQLLAADLRRGALIGQDALLRKDDVQIANQARTVALQGDLLCLPGVRHRTRFGLRFAFEAIQRCQLIPDFLVCGEDHLFVLRKGLSIPRLCLLDPGPSTFPQ